ncbi:glutamate carboxypeptidase [Polymorphobacter glacialis]|uniref:Glutamate carboxypeptidase n=1 Tax=Sandarakinorhabdus glacialis TaxID=1614636 RepID=A0A916ZKF1_9SPHN|nr:glutamate carboxypeptidase [Polymorphobacter glacialis]GGE00964.1 glutamate carboxypeptidase [Polymorphobacter glacialis]
MTKPIHHLAAIAAILAAPATAKIDPTLLKAATAEAPAVTKTLESLVNIESGTGDAEGMAALGTLIETALKAQGAKVERVAPLPISKGDIIVGRLTGTGRKNLLLLSHMDTVYQRGALAKAPFRIEGGKAYGPGIADDKGGIAVILHALKLLKPADYGSLTIVINTDEEKGSLGSGAIITELARGKDAVLSFEPTTMPEQLWRATSGTNTVTAVIKGKASHAGAAPEQGINALVEAAHVIEATRDLDQGPGKLRFNWTVIGQSPAGVRNIIPDNITLVGDLRTSTTAQFDTFKAEITRRLAKPSLPGAEIQLEVRVNRPPFTATHASDALIARARAIYADLGHPLEIEPRSGGGTDAGYAALANVPVIESLGLPGYGYHTGAAEYVFLEAVPRRLYLAAELIRQLGK